MRNDDGHRLWKERLSTVGDIVTVLGGAGFVMGILLHGLPAIVMFSISVAFVFVGVLAHVFLSSAQPLESMNNHLRHLPTQTRVLRSKSNKARHSVRKGISENKFSDFRIIFEGEVSNVLVAETWYFYDGALGRDNIFIEIEPVNNGEKLLGTKCDRSRYNVKVIGHKALAENLIYDYTSSSFLEREEESTHIQVSLLHNDTPIHRQLFPYKRTWSIKTQFPEGTPSYLKSDNKS